MSNTDNQQHRPDGWPLYPLAGAVGLYLAGLADLPTSGVLAVGAVAVLAAVLVSRARWDAITYGDALAVEATALAVLAPASGAVWVVAAGWVDPWSTLPWLGLWLAGVTIWWSSICLRAPTAAAVDWTPGAAIDPPPGNEFGPYPTILARAGVTRARVTGLTTVGDGLDIVSVEPLPGGDGQGRALTFSGFAGYAEAIGTECARYWAGHGHDLDAGDVTPLPGRNAASWLLYVARHRTLAGHDAVPFVDDDGPTEWCGPKRIGLYEDMRPLELVLCHERDGGKHGEIIGATGSGKGVNLAVLIARLTASNAGEVWLVGTVKLQKLAWGWVRPWLAGEVDRPAVDRVGGPNVRDALEALADALHYCTLCNANEFGDDARKPTPGRGALAVVIDEASDLLERRDQITLWDGRKMDASQIVAAIRKEGRTGPVQVFTANQDNLFESSGRAGPKGKRNSSIAIVGKVRTAQDASQPLAGLPSIVNPTRLTDNMVYVETGDDDHRSVRAKAENLHGEDRIAAVAARRAPWRLGLVPEYVAQLNHYRDRWDPSRHPDLARGCRGRGWTWPVAPLTLNQPEPPADQPVTGTPDHPARGGVTTVEPPAEPVAEPPVTTPARTTPEPPVTSANHPDDQPDRDVADQLPDGWFDDTFDVMAWFGETTTEPPGPNHPGGGADQPGHISAPATLADQIPTLDGQDVRALGRQMVEKERQRLAALPDIPAPLGLAIGLAAKRGAPEFIPTVVLAVAMGRVEKTAPIEERRRAAEQLGRELAAQDPELRSTQRRMGRDEHGRERRPSGYLAADLRAAANRWWGEPGNPSGTLPEPS